jgi:hypothetical protein
VDERGQVVSIVDNYDLLSYNVGPTLLSWLERQAPDVYEAVVRDRPGAMAQGYGHLILPLCNERDLRTQIRWGLADFAHRFGRPARGMWLPECAVNDTVLAALVEEGVGFTVLAPGQAAHDIDTRFPHRWQHPDGRGIDIVFYDGGLSHAVAFELPALSSQQFVDRIAGASTPGGAVTLATDGESFGHHHHFGERLLAHALTIEAPARGLTVTHPAAFLDATHERRPVQVAENSWSCAHGIERWRSDCGCATGGEPGWNQRWRTPLRHALDVLRDSAADIFERRGAEVLKDPWAARDAYVSVLNGAQTADDFLAQHAHGDRIAALTLLESQRFAMAMYTSCGWFFNDLAGLETVQVLRYAARVIDHLRDLGEDPGEEAFLDVLAQAQSNTGADGRQVWRDHVEPARVGPDRVAAHIALVDLLGDEPVGDKVGAFWVDLLDHVHRERGALALCTGRVRLTHVRTGAVADRTYSALHLGGLDVIGVCAVSGPGDQERLAELVRAFAAGEPATAIIKRMAAGGQEFDLSWALPDGAEQIVERTAAGLAERLAGAYDRIYMDHRRTLAALSSAGYPLPPELRLPAELALARRFEAAVAAASGSEDPDAYRAAAAIAREAKDQGFGIDTPQALATFERLLDAAVGRAVQDPERVEAALALINLAHELDLHPRRDRAQELVYRALQRAPTPALRLLGASLGLA